MEFLSLPAGLMLGLILAIVSSPSFLNSQLLLDSSHVGQLASCVVFRFSLYFFVTVIDSVSHSMCFACVCSLISTCMETANNIIQ